LVFQPDAPIFNTLAEKENFLVLYPDMNRHFKPSDMTGYNPFGCWNWFFDNNQHRGKGHPKLIYDIINEVKGTYNIINCLTIFTKMDKCHLGSIVQ